MKRVLITRTQPDAARTARAVSALSLEAIISPMLTIAPQPAPPPAGVRGVIFTSRSGAANTIVPPALRALPVWTVGAATAEAARAAGWRHITSADGDGAALASLIGAAAPAGPLAWMSGEEVAFDIAAALQPHGIGISRVVVYRAIATGRAPPLADFALFHSARAARVFVALAPGAAWARATALTLSAPIAEALKAFGFQQVVAAPEPTEAALIDSLAGLVG